MRKFQRCFVDRDRAESRGHHREYWSRRYPVCLGWIGYSKFLTHRYERRQAKRLVRKEIYDFDWNSM